MHFHFHLPHYFASKVRQEIGRLYEATAIGNLAQAMLVLFEPIFLYKVIGLSIPEILLFMAAVYALYILFISFGAKIASRYGYAHSIFFSIPFQILFWLSLIGSQYNMAFLFIAPILFAIQKSLFWPAWHATLARYANGKQVAREFSFMYAIMSLMQILGPMVGGFLAFYWGVNSIFIIGCVIYLASAIPLLKSREIFIPKMYKFADTWALFKSYPIRFMSYIGFGEELLVLTIWPLYIFSIITNYQDLGIFVTIATLVATAIVLYIGTFSDHHNKTTVARVGIILTVLSWLARLRVFGAFGAFITDSFSRTSKSLFFIPVVALTYERAESTHILPYVVGFEMVLSVGKLFAALLGLIIFAATGSFMALFILAAVFSLFYFLI